MLEKASGEPVGNVCSGFHSAIPGRAIIDPRMPASHDICSLGLRMEAGVAVTLTEAQLALPASGGDDAELSLLSLSSLNIGRSHQTDLRRGSVGIN